MSSFISQNLTKTRAFTRCTFACICHTVFRMFSCLQINWQPFYLRQLLKFHTFDWLIEIYLQTEGQGTHHKMVSLQPMPGFPSVCLAYYYTKARLSSGAGTRSCRRETRGHVFRFSRDLWNPRYLHASYSTF